MEGPLSKWTNVIEGWQYRWFVLDETAGILTYYTSKEKMTKGEMRGCVRLKGAVIGIDDEDDSTFTITVDQKMFHFQARDAEERESWIRALESTVQRVSGYYKLKGKKWSDNVTSINKSCLEFERRISEADSYLQLMLDNIKNLERNCNNMKPCDDKARAQKIIEIATAMSESVKHSIIFLQMTKNQLCPTDKSLSVPPIATSSIPRELSSSNNAITPASRPVERLVMAHIRSYSSSDEEETDDIYFDTVEQALNVDVNFAEDALLTLDDRPKSLSGTSLCPSLIETGVEESYGFSADVDFDAVYEDDEEDELENVQEHGSIIMHMLSQLSVGMDLTKIALPTFILERRSLLEMFADFFAHPDLFIRINDQPTAEERMIATVKWYLSSFHAGRKSSVAKKPYNPIIGETFRCLWNFSNDSFCNGANFHKIEPSLQHANTFLPGVQPEQLAFLAEQVSHHPPISALYAEYAAKNMRLNGHIWTKSKFLGLSIAVHNVGQATLYLDHFNEEYVLTFPSGYGRSILGTPWIELGGKCSIKCDQTGYFAAVDFLTKPFYGGKAHQIKGEIFRPQTKLPFATVKGQWNGEMTIKIGSREEVFLDVHRIEMTKKIVKPILEQEELESRRLWKYVTAALKRKDVHLATKAKHSLEQRQRNEAKERSTNNLKWQPKFFHQTPENGENWTFRKPIV